MSSALILKTHISENRQEMSTPTAPYSGGQTNAQVSDVVLMDVRKTGQAFPHTFKDMALKRG